MEEVMECCRMAGGVDYGLRVVVSDAAAFDVSYERLIETIPRKNVTSRFALNTSDPKLLFQLPTGVNRARKGWSADLQTAWSVARLILTITAQ
jgi:hypothetical protein